jgi:hypothetical protein
MMATPYGYPFAPGSTGYDVSVYNCPPLGQLPSPRSFGIVEVNGNSVSKDIPNPCYQSEIAWAGPNASSYIFMNGLPTPETPPQSYTYGLQLASGWVAYSRSVGVNTSFWWLDVETAPGFWNLSPSAQVSNAYVVAGAVAGLRASGVVAGIYSTAYQWGVITGATLNFPGIALWVPGAGGITGVNSAATFCAGPVLPLYEPFAGGVTVLVQYGYTAQGQQFSTDPDYACL